MPEEKDPGEYTSVERLKKQLDLRNPVNLDRGRSSFSSGVGRDQIPGLTEEEIIRENQAPAAAASFPFMYKIFVGSLVFFIVALGLAAYFFFSGSSVFSLDDIEISLTGPVAIEGGKELVLQVALANKNSLELQTTDFVVEYPDGTRDPDTPSKPLTRTREFLDLVRPGQVINKTVRAILFGQENSEKTIKVRLEFQVPNSNATFKKEKTYTLALTSSPVGVTLALPEEIVSGDEVFLDIAVASNSDSSVRGVLAQIAYPPGFSFKSADPAPTFQTSVWQLGDLTPGQKRTIRVTGTQEGQNNETKAFKVSVGTESEKASDTIGTTYTSVFKTLSIQQPHLGAELSLGGSTDAIVVSRPGAEMAGVIRITNNLSEQILDPAVSVRFLGSALDEATVDGTRGAFYSSADDTLKWDKSGDKELEALEPGAEHEFEFSFKTFGAFSPSFPKTRNPDVMVELTVRGTRLPPGRSAEEVVTVVKRRVKLSSVAQLSSRLVYSTGPFKNTGPLPPKADQETTYTVIWSLTNLSSDISETAVTATLPQYVEWLGAVSPAAERVSFSGGKVVWSVGSLKAGTGISTSAREVSFQVKFKPSIAQVGTSPVLVSDASLTATDDFTRAKLESTQRSLTTSLPTDPNYRDGQDKVIK